MQNFYGLAILQNCESLYLTQYYGIVQNLIKMMKKMKTRGKNIAIDFAHKVVPAGVNSKKLEQSGSDKSGYNISINIPEFIHDIIKTDIFEIVIR